MPITFELFTEQNYFISRYTGTIVDGEIISAWEQFFASGRWQPGMNEFADLSQADYSQRESFEMGQLVTYISQMYQQKGVKKAKVAIYAPDDLMFGLSRTYEALTEPLVQQVMVFRDREEAMDWLLRSSETKQL